MTDEKPIYKRIYKLLEHPPKDAYTIAYTMGQTVGTDEAFRIAAMFGQPDIMRILIAEFDANVLRTRREKSDRPGHADVKRNLIDDVLDALLTRTDINRSGAGRFRHLEAVKILVQNGVSIRINQDPLEGPMLAADLWHTLKKAKDRMLPHYDLAAGTVLEENFQPFGNIYTYLKEKFPHDFKDYEIALNDERARLCSEFDFANRFLEEEMPPDTSLVRRVVSKLGLPRLS